MAPSKGKREQLKQAKLEAWEQTRRRERLNTVEEESRERLQLDFRQEFDWQGIMLHRLEEYTTPESGLSLPMSSFVELEKRYKTTERRKDELLFETKQQLLHAMQSKQVLEKQLREVLGDQRQLRDLLLKKMEVLKTEMLQKVDAAIDGPSNFFQNQVDETKQGYFDLMSEIRSRCDHFTDILKEAKASHSNLPARIRHRLHKMSVEEVVLIIDTLSFEPEVLQYFMFKFPPQPDFPYGVLSQRPRD